MTPWSAATEVHAVDPGPRPSLAIAGRADRFPVRRIYCVGQNYRAHAFSEEFARRRDDPAFLA